MSKNDYRSKKGSGKQPRDRDDSYGKRKYRNEDNKGNYKKNDDSKEQGYRKSRRGPEPNESGIKKGRRGFKNSNDSEYGGFTNQKRRNFRKDEYTEARGPRDRTSFNRESNAELTGGNINREDRIEGRNSVFEAIRSGRPLNKLFVLKDSEDVMTRRIVAMAREKDIPIQYFERPKLDAISQTRTHQGVILEVAAKEYVGIDEILKVAEERGEQPFILALDGITDTNNLGSIIRSAECVGVHGIILPKRRSATLNATVAKVAAGALEYVPVARVSNLVQTLRSLKKDGLWVMGADMDGESHYHSADLTGPAALVIGSEGEGLSRLVKAECDIMVNIPMKGKISSLNAGVAAALIMFEIRRQREIKV